LGAYVFCDYVSGNIWALRYGGTQVTDFHNLLQNGSALVQKGIAAFGTDPRNGDILLADFDHNVVRRLLPLPPTLTFTNGPGQYTLSWPSSPDAFDLYGANDITKPISWSPAGNAPVLANGRWTVVIDANDQRQFYRLQAR
jgi:hypothetical protein